MVEDAESDIAIRFVDEFWQRTFLLPSASLYSFIYVMFMVFKIYT